MLLRASIQGILQTPWRQAASAFASDLPIVILTVLRIVVRVGALVMRGAALHLVHSTLLTMHQEVAITPVFNK